jgi:hypothetical protein
MQFRKYFSVEFLAILFAIYTILVLLPISKSFPYSDDWWYISQLNNFNFLLFFEKHNEHYIPLQRFLQFSLLKISGGDFRVLIGFNIIITTVISLIWINIFKKLGNNLDNSIIIFIIPLIFLNWGFNTVNWGFNFQFISSIFFITISFNCWINFLHYPSRGINSTFISLILLALCGANGLINSFIIGFGFLFILSFFCSRRMISIVGRFIILSWLIICFFILYKTLIVSTASPINSSYFIKFIIGIANSWAGLYATTFNIWGLILTITLVLFPFVYLCWTVNAYRSNRIQLNQLLTMISLTFILLGSVITILLVSVSRSTSTTWWPGLELHYGFLVTLLPITFLLVLSFFKARFTRALVSLIFFYIVFSGFLSNLNWRISSAQEGFEKITQASAAILSPQPAHDVSEKYIKEFNWVSNESSINMVADGLKKLRQLPLWLSKN